MTTLEAFRGVRWNKTRVVIIDPDADGTFAYLLALKTNRQNKLFPGIEKAPVVIEPDDEVLERKYGAFLDVREAVAFDISGRRPFDHHPAEDYPDECAFKNVAVLSGWYAQHPAHRKMAQDAALWDTKGGGDRVWGAMNFMWNRLRGENPKWWTSGAVGQKILQQALAYARETFQNWLFREKNFWDDGAAQTIERGTIVSADGKLKACIVKTDNPLVRERAQSEGHAVVAQINSRGQLFIRGNKRITDTNTAAIIERIVEKLRIELASINGCIVVDAEELLEPGLIASSPELYYAPSNREVFIGGNQRRISKLPAWEPAMRDKLIQVAVTSAINEVT